MSSRICRSDFDNLPSSIINRCNEQLERLGGARTTAEWRAITRRKRPTRRSRFPAHATHSNTEKECHLDAAACKLKITQSISKLAKVCLFANVYHFLSPTISLHLRASVSARQLQSKQMSGAEKRIVTRGPHESRIPIMVLYRRSPQ